MRTLISLCIVCLPLKHLQINSDFGSRIHPVSGRYILHQGVDMKARHDTVYAILNGIVKSAGYDNDLGIYIRLSHGTVESVYGHLSKIMVGHSDSVTTGQPVAITGATGRVTGEHLHFCIRCKQRYINPIGFLYQLLNKNEHEQKFQSTPDTAFRKADRGDQRR